MTSARKDWTTAEIALLRKLYPDQAAKDVAQQLGRTLSQVYAKAAELGIRKSDAFKSSPASGRLQKGNTPPDGEPWTEQQLSVLLELYASTPSQEIADRIGRSLTSVYKKATILGLKKSEAFKASEASGRIQTGSDIGKATQFKPGRVSENKGKRRPARGRAKETQFKPGHRTHNWLPVGTERRHASGYLQRKMTDTGYPPRDWKFVHRLLWVEHNGPIPKDHVVVFRNGNKSDIRIENLELISRAELQRRNSVHNLPEPLREVINVRRQIVRHVNKRMRNVEEQD